nr:lipase family protein [Desulfobulbaceae bacterium]
MTEYRFEYQTTEFSLHKAFSLARAADLAYKNPAEIKSVVHDHWGMDTVTCFDEPTLGTQGYVMSNDTAIVVAFRGTQITRPEDISTDLKFFPVDGPYAGQVHSGFLNALNRAWPEVEQAVASSRTRSKSLWFTGHSLGAALATLAVAKLRDINTPVAGLYTFGQPRTGNRVFARNFNSDFGKYAFRFVNNNDVVTRIPPRELQYSHVGNLKYFTEDGRLVDDISFWNRFLDRIHGRMEDFLEWGTDGLSDHDMPKYLALIEGVLQSATR